MGRVGRGWDSGASWTLTSTSQELSHDGKFIFAGKLNQPRRGLPERLAGCGGHWPGTKAKVRFLQQGQRLGASWAGQGRTDRRTSGLRGDCNPTPPDGFWAPGSRQGSRLHEVYKQTQQQPCLKAEELGIQLGEEVA